ncbi:MAG: DEAD/DEAH box helicase, partial [Candidatus Omnitrophica bacterium]|nr:DEAD/DEAH box helicase [Candidatus Omnitrophota bacterium]
PHWFDGAKKIWKTSIDASALIFSHHSCLDYQDLRDKLFNHTYKDFTKQHLEALSVCKWKSNITGNPISRIEEPLFLRMGLSSLVNGDWDNSAEAKGNDVPICEPVRWEERLKSLEAFVKSKTKEKTEQINVMRNSKVKSFQKKRHELRQRLWQHAGETKLSSDIYVLSATVGMGKTFSFLRFAIRQAIKQNSPHIFIVAPYNHIVDQLVSVVSSALVLPGEDKQKIVCNHTCTAEYNERGIQNQTTRWRCPVIITSSVQFFETLSSNTAGKLIKLAEVPNSVVVIDEWHSVMEENLVGFYWDIMTKLSKFFRTKFILSSGSMTRFWDKKLCNKFVQSNNRIRIKEIVSKSFMKDSIKSESGRLSYHYIGEIDPQRLADSVLTGVGQNKKTIVLVSTTRNVAVMAKKLIGKGRNVYCVYGSIIDEDSAKNVSEIKNDDTDWITICTTSIESGIDISAEIAFSVERSIMSQIQLGGRVNREGNYKNAKVFIFREIIGKGVGCFNCNSSFFEPSRISYDLIKVIDNAEFSAREYISRFHLVKNNKLSEAVELARYPEISKETRIIKEGRSSVLVGQNAKTIFDKLVDKHLNGAKNGVGMKDVAKNSVPCPTLSENAGGFSENEFQPVPGFEFDKTQPLSVKNSSLLFYDGPYDGKYFGIWKGKEYWL